MNGKMAESPMAFKPAPCAACGCARCRVVSWVEVLVHRLASDRAEIIQKNGFICLGCGIQRTVQGGAVSIENPDRLPPEQLARLL